MTGVRFRWRPAADAQIPAASRGRLLLLVAVSAMLLFFDFGSRVLATNDETRFPMLARDILANGNWLVPRLGGVPHLNKPPLHAWLIALASWPAGSVTPGTAVLPSLLAALCVVVVTFWIAERLFGAQTALVAGLTVLTTLGVFSWARIPMPDMTLCAAVTLAMAAYVAAEFGGARAGLIAFYGLVGIASLTKGPVGLLPLAVVAVYTVAARGWSGFKLLCSVPGLVLLVVLSGGWWVVAAVVGRGAFVRDIVVSDLLLWYVPTHGWGWHRVTDPLVQAIAVLLPWSLLLPFAGWAAMRAAEPERARRTQLLLVWLGAVFVLVAVSQEQRTRYYLPLCPPAALLIGAWYDTLRSRWRAVGFAGAWMAVVAIGLAVHANVLTREIGATDLDVIRGQLPRTATIYSVEAPDLVFSFYFERPVVPLARYREFKQRAQGVDRQYLIAGERGLPASPDAGVRRIATGLVNRRPVVLLTREPVSSGVAPTAGEGPVR